MGGFHCQELRGLQDRLMLNSDTLAICRTRQSFSRIDSNWEYRAPNKMLFLLRIIISENTLLWRQFHDLLGFHSHPNKNNTIIFSSCCFDNNKSTSLPYTSILKGRETSKNWLVLQQLCLTLRKQPLESCQENGRVIVEQSKWLGYEEQYDCQVVRAVLSEGLFLRPVNKQVPDIVSKQGHFIPKDEKLERIQWKSTRFSLIPFI